jgi:hypothetical protein
LDDNMHDVTEGQYDDCGGYGSGGGGGGGGNGGEGGGEGAAHCPGGSTAS